MALKKQLQFLKKCWKRIQSPFRRSRAPKGQVVISRPMNVQKDGDPLASMMNLAQNQEYLAREAAQNYEFGGALQGPISSTVSLVPDNSGEEGAIGSDDGERGHRVKTPPTSKNRGSEA